MKKTIIAVLTVAALTSCASGTYSVKLRNNSVVKAKDDWDRSFKEGDVVCISSPVSYLGNWTIDNTGRMKDTMYFTQVKSRKGDTIGLIIETRIGVIIK